MSKYSRYVPRTTALLLFILIIGMTLTGCGSNDNSSGEKNNAKNDEKKTPFVLTSTAFENNGRIDDKYTHTKGNISVPLAWSGAPKGTKSFAVLIVDLNPVANNWIHWEVINIPADVQSLPEGVSGTDQLPAGSKELSNSFGQAGYGGPEPPSGSGDHEYKCIVYAMNAETVDLSGQVSYAAFQKLTEKYVIDKAELSGFYEVK